MPRREAVSGSTQWACPLPQPSTHRATIPLSYLPNGPNRPISEKRRPSASITRPLAPDATLAARRGRAPGLCPGPVWRLDRGGLPDGGLPLGWLALLAPAGRGESLDHDVRCPAAIIICRHRDAVR